jgi:pimeloyl-ACP methyl ester carboxylesterase
MTPTRYVDPASITCPAVYYVGSRDWIVPHVRADVAAVGATLDEIPRQTHLSAFYGAAQPVLAAVVARLG